MQPSTSKFIDFHCLFKEHLDDSGFQKPIETEDFDLLEGPFLNLYT
jgi:hypothetical protein